MGKSKQAYVRVAPDHNGLHGPEAAHQCPDCVRYELKMIKAESPEAVAARAAYAKGWAAAMERAAEVAGMCPDLGDSHFHELSALASKPEGEP